MSDIWLTNEELDEMFSAWYNNAEARDFGVKVRNIREEDGFTRTLEEIRGLAETPHGR